jgi:hypothetical protein
VPPLAIVENLNVLENVAPGFVEGQFARWKQVIGDELRFHTDEARATEVAIAAAALNQMLDLGCPSSVRVA